MVALRASAPGRGPAPRRSAGRRGPCARGRPGSRRAGVDSRSFERGLHELPGDPARPSAPAPPRRRSARRPSGAGSAAAGGSRRPSTRRPSRSAARSRGTTRRSRPPGAGSLARLRPRASAARTWRASPAKTSGGSACSRRRTTCSTARRSGHAGCWSASWSRQDDGDQVESTTAIASTSVGTAPAEATLARMRIFSGIQPTGREALRQLVGRVPPVRRDAGARGRGGRRGVLLHRRPPLDHGRLRPRRPARAHARPGGAPLRDRPRPRALDGLRPEPRDRPRRGGVAALRRHELRPARPDDAVQGQGRAAGVRHAPGSSPTRS